MNKPVPLFFILLRARGRQALPFEALFVLKGYLSLSYLKLLTCAKECGKLHIVSND